MDNFKWFPVLYKGFETNIEVTKCGKVKRVKVDWVNKVSNLGEIDFEKIKLSKGYKKIHIRVKKIDGFVSLGILVHQVIALTFLSHNIKGHKLVINHKDSNPLNNHINNLEIITQRENNSKERTNKSGLPVGIHLRKDIMRYQSKIYIDGESRHLGYFKTIEEASNKYQEKLKSLC
jgi:hypothetical protein